MTTTHPMPTDDPMTGTSVIPILVYEDIEAAHDFLIRAFGFTSGGIFRADDGAVVHAEVRAGDCPVWLHAATEEHQMASPRGARDSHGGLEVIVPDVDAHFARAKAAGARIEREPTDQDYGLREYGVRDPENHRWWFSSPLAG
jgi:MerR family transcriptional regulator, thiopeptide resistance regulator